MKNYPQIGLQVPNILLPKPGTDYSRWAVIACDQFTSEPEYWQQVEAKVANAPSTFRITLPEVFLGTPEEPARVAKINETMRQYLSEGMFSSHEGLILVERFAEGKTRFGLMVALDLERYDFNKGSQSLIRATEGTILDRLPPRMKIREGAAIELPHILVLIDDPQRTVIEPLVARRDSLPKLYDFELMLGSGHLKGYSAADAALEAQVITALTKLADPQSFVEKYGVSADLGVLLFAMGDGNHSLATAKAIWEKIKDKVGMDHPARYALVEIENIHDEGLEFEPIHRVLFNVKQDFRTAISAYYPGKIQFEKVTSQQEMVQRVDEQKGSDQCFGLISSDGFEIVSITDPKTNLPVGTLQLFLDVWGKNDGFEKIDYVHGEDVTVRLGSQAGHLGLYVPAIDKFNFFKTVIVDGALPRKTFSMGEAKEKRFYLEARQITNE